MHVCQIVIIVIDVCQKIQKNTLVGKLSRKSCFFSAHDMHIPEGLPGVLGNKGTLAKYRREQGNISQFLGTGNKISKNYSTKTF